VELVFLHQHDAEHFLTSSASTGLTLHSKPLSATWTPEKQPLPIPDPVALEIFNRGKSRVMGISIRPDLYHTELIEPEDIIGLNAEIQDPRGGILRMSKKATGCAEEGTEREVIGVEFACVMACLAAWSRIERESSTWEKFRACVVVSLADSCGIRKQQEELEKGESLPVIGTLSLRLMLT
jgi:hypothetical protein